MDVATQTKKASPKDSKMLQNTAAAAALYVTSADRQSKLRKNPLDANNKLSSASAATSLRHAEPRDLPSYPSVGLADTSASAGAAASLANTNQKTFELWKPEFSSPAHQAAMLANGYQMSPLWKPELSAAGSKAAILASNREDLSPKFDYGYTKDGRSKALLAATGAMSGRRRAGSTPPAIASYPDAQNSAANALNAAHLAHRPSIKARVPQQLPAELPGFSPAEASRIHNAAITNLGREMYTSHPPVAPEVEERTRKAGLHAAAISMAKSMYTAQQKLLEQRQVGNSDSLRAANSVHPRKSTTFEGDNTHYGAAQYAHLQETAQKLAAQRMAKLHDEPAAYRNYYGASTSPRSRLSLRGSIRGRAASPGQLVPTDEERSREIRSQMSLFNDKIAEVDLQKRQSDREALMAAAQRNVSKRMSGMDEKVFADTGKVSPAMMADWEAKARLRAEEHSSARMANHGKVAIGGGKYMDQSEIDAIAATRVQPTLDEITHKAAAQRQMDEDRRLAEVKRRKHAEALAIEERERHRAEKEHDAEIKEEWKHFKEEEKRDRQAKKEEARAKKVEKDGHEKEEKRTSRLASLIGLGGKKKDLEANTAKGESPAVMENPAESSELTMANVERSAILSETEVKGTNQPSRNYIANELMAENNNPALENTLDNATARDIAARVMNDPVLNTDDDMAILEIPSGKQARRIEGASIDHGPMSSGNEPTEKTFLYAAKDTAQPQAFKETTKLSKSRDTGKPVTAFESTTETTVVGSPSKSTTSARPKEAGGLSSWLKSKIHRQSKQSPSGSASSALETSSSSTKDTTQALQADESSPTHLPLSVAATNSKDIANPTHLEDVEDLDTLAADPPIPAASSFATPTAAHSAPRDSSLDEIAIVGKRSVSSLPSDAYTRDEPRGRSTMDKPALASSGYATPLTTEPSVAVAATEAETESHGAATKSHHHHGEVDTPDVVQSLPLPLPLPGFVAQGKATESPTSRSRFVEDL